MKRRLWLTLGVAGAAAAAGGAVSWWRLRPGPVGELASFWAASFDTPDGGSLDMRSFAGRPLLINFWATWCAPCVREMPAIDRFYREFQGQGWQAVGLAIDGPTPVRDFLAKLPVSFPIGLAGFGGTEIGRTLGNTSGGLPFTVMIDARGQVAQRKLGETTYEELAGWARNISA